MEIKNTQQLYVDDLFAMDFDLLLCASGVEKRGPYFAEKYGSKINAKKRIALAYTDREILMNQKNRSAFIRYGFDLLDSKGETLNEVLSIAKDLLKLPKSEINVLIDYSSMTKIWYGGLLNTLLSTETNKKINLFYTYTPALHEKVSEEHPNAYIDILPGYSRLTLPNEKRILLIGLGQEKVRAIGLVEYLEINNGDIFLFHSDNKFNSAIANEVYKKNSDLIKTVSRNRVLKYDINDMKAVESTLMAICYKTNLDNPLSGISLAPLGPKPFALICMVVAKKLDNVKVFRIGAGEQGSPAKRYPDTTKRPIVYKIIIAPNVN